MKKRGGKHSSGHASDEGPGEKGGDETSDDAILDDGGAVMVGLVVEEVRDNRGGKDESGHPDGDDGGHAEWVWVNVIGDHLETKFSSSVEDGVRFEQLVA